MTKLQERFFILTPTPTTQTKKDKMGNTLPVYLDAEGKPMMWSGDFPIPAVGSKVYVRLNSIGWATVKGFFESEGYVGLMTLPSKPPKWLRDQQRREKDQTDRPKWMQEGIGCEFGLELSLKRPKTSGEKLRELAHG